MAKSPKLTKAQQAQIRQIKAKGYSASYEKRLIRGVKAGKSRQQARGHKPQEHVERREREREENEGLTRDNIRSIGRWYDRFNPAERKQIPSLDDVIEFAQAEGYGRFVIYRKIWDAARRIYLRELAKGTYSPRGLGYLEMLTDMAEVRPHGDSEWLYYH